ncbi:MAG: hypothetical protein CL843_12375 [Crocinitomicaceae bacterium]|nr:hypothetical protein [Crocinitomicaceae bacterium]
MESNNYTKSAYYRKKRLLNNLLSTAFILQGFIGLYFQNPSFPLYYFYPFMILYGIGLAIYSAATYGKLSLFTIRFSITDKGIICKNNWFKPAKNIAWSEIKSIKIGTRQAKIHLGTNIVVVYNYDRDFSSDIKRNLRNSAFRNGIQVYP